MAVALVVETGVLVVVLVVVDAVSFAVVSLLFVCAAFVDVVDFFGFFFVTFDFFGCGGCCGGCCCGEFDCGSCCRF